MKGREVIGALESDGWYLVRQKGSHQQFQHTTKPGTVTIACQPGHDFPVGTLARVIKQARVNFLSNGRLQYASPRGH